jgi:hypothetical protein
MKEESFDEAVTKAASKIGSVTAKPLKGIPKDCIVVCMRIKDTPIPSVVSEKALCDDCKDRIWVADSSPKHYAKRICFQCFSDAAQNSKGRIDVGMSEQALEQLRNLK